MRRYYTIVLITRLRVERCYVHIGIESTYLGYFYELQSGVVVYFSVARLLNTGTAGTPNSIRLSYILYGLRVGAYFVAFICCLSNPTPVYQQLSVPIEWSEV